MDEPKQISLKEFGKSVSKFVKNTLKSNVLLNEQAKSVSSGIEVIFEGNSYYAETIIRKIDSSENKIKKVKKK